MGFSYQKAKFVSDPLDEKARKKWLKQTWPEIRKLAHEKDSLVLFGDEALFPQWGCLSKYVRILNPKTADSIEVTNLHALARTICTRSGWKGRIGDDEDYDSIWANPELGELPMSRDELKQEYWMVIDANGIDNEEAYLTTVGSGRPRMGRNQRRQA